MIDEDFPLRSACGNDALRPQGRFLHRGGVDHTIQDHFAGAGHLGGVLRRFHAPFRGGCHFCFIDVEADHTVPLFDQAAREAFSHEPEPDEANPVFAHGVSPLRLFPALTIGRMRSYLLRRGFVLGE